jgi:hypothetical protein
MRTLRGGAPKLYTRSMLESNSEATGSERHSSVIGSREERGVVEVCRQGVVRCNVCKGATECLIPFGIEVSLLHKSKTIQTIKFECININFDFEAPISTFE